MTLDEPRQRLQVAERRRPYAEAVRGDRLAVAGDEEADLPFRRLDRVVGLAGRRLDQPRDLAEDRPFGQTVDRLPDDPERLPELLDAHQIPTVGVAQRADGDIEVEVGVRRVRLVLPHVARDARTAQQRTAQPERDRVLGGDDADLLRALLPDAVVRQQLFVLRDFRLEEVTVRADLLVPSAPSPMECRAAARRCASSCR